MTTLWLSRLSLVAPLILSTVICWLAWRTQAGHARCWPSVLGWTGCVLLGSYIAWLHSERITHHEDQHWAIRREMMEGLAKTQERIEHEWLTARTEIGSNHEEVNRRLEETTRTVSVSQAQTTQQVEALSRRVAQLTQVLPMESRWYLELTERLDRLSAQAEADRASLHRATTIQETP